jgi:hypothetical protein
MMKFFGEATTFPIALCAKCSKLMTHDYHCAGCDKSIHWFCSEGDSNENESKGHGAHYWCSPCYSSQKQGHRNSKDIFSPSSGDTNEVFSPSPGDTNEVFSPCPGGTNEVFSPSPRDTNEVLSPCAKCGQVMNCDYRCVGCDKCIHWFCSEGDSEANESKGHGAHYWCHTCFLRKDQPEKRNTAAKDRGGNNRKTGVGNAKEQSAKKKRKAGTKE